jgi:hypothetical protein
MSLYQVIDIEKLGKNGELCDGNTVLNKEIKNSLSV